jgi:hypothetical protein
MDPNPRKLLGPSALIYLIIEETGNAVIVKDNGNVRATLAHQGHVFHQQQFRCRANPKGAYFRGPPITHTQDFGPRIGGQSESGSPGESILQGWAREA